MQILPGGSSFKTGLKKIFLKQKQSAKIIFHKDRLTHVRPLMNQLKALNVYQINVYQIASFMYQVKNGSIPKIFSSDFSSVEHSYPTRFSRKTFNFLDH